MANWKTMTDDITEIKHQLMETTQQLRKAKSLLIRAKDAVGVAHISVKDSHPMREATRKLWDDIEHFLHKQDAEPCKGTGGE